VRPWRHVTWGGRSTEPFIRVVRGDLAPGAAVFARILAARAGNVPGGTGIFAALTHARVRAGI